MPTLVLRARRRSCTPRGHLPRSGAGAASRQWRPHDVSAELRQRTDELTLASVVCCGLRTSLPAHRWGRQHGDGVRHGTYGRPRGRGREHRRGLVGARAGAGSAAASRAHVPGEEYALCIIATFP